MGDDSQQRAPDAPASRHSATAVIVTAAVVVVSLLLAVWWPLSLTLGGAFNEGNRTPTSTYVLLWGWVGLWVIAVPVVAIRVFPRHLKAKPKDPRRTQVVGGRIREYRGDQSLQHPRRQSGVAMDGDSEHPGLESPAPKSPVPRRSTGVDVGAVVVVVVSLLVAGAGAAVIGAGNAAFGATQKANVLMAVWVLFWGLAVPGVAIRALSSHRNDDLRIKVVAGQIRVDRVDHRNAEPEPRIRVVGGQIRRRPPVEVEDVGDEEWRYKGQHEQR